MSQIPDAGDIITIDFEPQAGREISKRRPALVLSPKRFNAKLGFAWICPITSKPARHHFQLTLPAVIPGFSPPSHGGVSTVKIEQLRSLDYEARKAAVIAKVPPSFLAQCRSIVARVIEVSP